MDSRLKVIIGGIAGILGIRLISALVIRHQTIKAAETAAAQGKTIEEIQRDMVMDAINKQSDKIEWNN